MLHHPPVVIDLCRGAGGFSEGFKQAGFDIKMGIDIWDIALQSFRINHKCEILETDIREVTDLPDCDMVIASPPCQSFSRLQNGRRTFDTSVIDHIYELIKNTPYVFENVWQARNVFRDNKARFYAQRFGVPQIRERLFVSSMAFQLYPVIHNPMSTILNGSILTTFANTSGRGKRLPDGTRYKTMDEMCWTIDTSGSSLRLDGQLLSIKDYKKLMGFQEDYFFSGSKTNILKQLGNAVCPPVAKSIAQGIVEDYVL